MAGSANKRYVIFTIFIKICLSFQKVLLEKEEEKEIVDSLRNNGLNVGIIFQEPWAYPCALDMKSGDGRSCMYPGMGIEFTETICDRLNIQCRYIFQNFTDNSPTMDTHQALATRITGFGGDKDYELDTSLPILVETPRFREMLEFTMPVFYMEFGVLIKTRFLDNNNELFFAFKPFTWIVWIILISSILTVSCLDALFRLIWTPIAERKGKRTYLMHTESSWLMTFGILMSRGMDIPIPHLSRRVLMVTWGLACIIICNVYSAQLVSTKVALKIQQPFTNLQELADKVRSKQYRLLIYSPDSKFIQDIEDDPNGPYSYLRDALLTNKPTYINDLSNITSNIIESKENLALFGSQFTLKAISKNNCNVTIIKLSVTDFGAFAFKHSKNFALLFTRVILGFKERGYYMEKLEHKYSYGRDCESRKEASTSTGDKDEMKIVELENVLIVFYVLVVGCIVAAFGFGLEIIYRRICSDYILEAAKIDNVDSMIDMTYHVVRNSIYSGNFFPANIV